MSSVGQPFSMFRPTVTAFRSYWGVWLVLVFGIALTVIATQMLSRVVHEKDEERFRNTVERATTAVANRLDTYIAMLRATSGFFSAVPEPRFAEFREYVDRLRLQESYPGIQGIGWSQRFPLGRDDPALARLQAENPDLLVWPGAPREELHSIVYLLPLDRRNRAAIGYDMFSEPVRRAAMEQARDTGRPAASGKVTLVQEIDEEKQSGFLIYVPVYEGRGTPPTVEERRARLRGFVYSPFRADDLLRGIFAGERRPRLDFRVFDGAAADPAMLLHDSSRRADAPPAPAPAFTAAEQLTVAGRPWTLAFATRPDFEVASSADLVPLVTLFGGIATLLFTVFTASLIAARLAAERSQQENARLLEQLREADRRKDDFLAMLAHELRNPLAPIRNAAYLLRRARDEQAIDSVRQILDRQVAHMKGMVDDLLDVSRLTRGKIQLRREPLDLAEAVAFAAEDQRGALEGRGLALHTELPDASLWIDGDRVRLVQVVQNLLENAGKFTDAGGRIEVSLRHDRESGEAVLRVRDNGIGIESEMLPRIFDPFTQADRSLQRSRGGLGLGLALVKGVVDLHGGSVRVISAGAGQGTEVVVRLPAFAEPPALTARDAPAALPRRELRALLIEDNPDSAHSLRMLLEHAGCKVSVAYDGQEGVTLAGAVRPDVVLCDIGLPGMDGFAVARALRAEPSTAGSFLIAITGYGQKEDRQRALDSGFDCHVVKPADPEELLDLMSGIPPRDGHGET